MVFENPSKNNWFLKTILKPADYISGVLFFEQEGTCWDVVDRIRFMKDNELSPCSLEYFDHFSLKRLKTYYPNIPDAAKAALFFEQDVALESQTEGVLEKWFKETKGYYYIILHREPIQLVITPNVF